MSDDRKELQQNLSRLLSRGMRMVVIHEYDGATSVAYVPRHPVAIHPSFDGSSG
jgi:hypothetical protein